MRNMYETLSKLMLGDSATLKLRCEACGHAAELSRRDAFATFGAGASAFMIRRRSKCRQCGEQRRLAVWI